MFVDFGLLIDAVLLAAGVWWCYHMFGRWRSDLTELREPRDRLEKAVIVGLWLVTLVILAAVVNFAAGVVANIVEGIRSF